MAIDFNDFNKLKPLYQVAIVVGVCAGLLGLLWYSYLSPMELDIASKEGQLAELQAQIAKSLAQQKILAQFKAESEALAVRLNELKSILPLDRETDQLLRSVEDTAIRSSLRILRLGPRPQVDHEIYTEWPIDMEVVGTYHNVGLFLDRIRQLPRIFNVTNLRISSRASTGEQSYSASVGATYTATTFIYREEQIASTAPPPRPAGQ